MFSPYSIIAALLVAFGAFLGGVKVGMDHERAAAVDKQALIAEAVDAANGVAAETIAKLSPVYTTIQGKLEKQIETNTVYRDCRVDAVGVQLLNQALSGGTRTPGQGELPKADTPGR